MKEIKTMMNNEIKMAALNDDELENVVGGFSLDDMKPVWTWICKKIGISNEVDTITIINEPIFID